MWEEGEGFGSRQLCTPGDADNLMFLCVILLSVCSCDVLSFAT